MPASTYRVKVPAVVAPEAPEAAGATDRTAARTVVTATTRRFMGVSCQGIRLGLPAVRQQPQASA